MSDIDGVYDKDPNTYSDAVLIEHIGNVAEIRASIDTEEEQFRHGRYRDETSRADDGQ